MNARMTTALGLLLVAFLAADATAAEVVWRDGKWVRLAEPVEGTPEGEAAIVRKHLDEKQYGAAVKSAKKFLKRYRSTDIREEVFNLAGDAELARKRYWPAYKWYEKQLKEFPSGKRLERALAKEMLIAQAFLAGNKRKLLGLLPVSAVSDGIDILQRIAERAPGTPQAELALLTIGDHYFNKGKWEEAIDAYDAYLLLFGKSTRAPYAELQAAEALQKSYRGANWDETPLIEAEQRYRAFARRYPAAAEKAGVAKIIQQVRALRAANQFEVAEFYLRTGKAKAAEYYYTLVIGEYSDTPWADKARGKLASLVPATGAAPDGKEPRK